jgi:hypothetical protein
VNGTKIRRFGMFFAPEEGVTKLLVGSLGEEVKIGKLSQTSIPGKGELFWREVAQGSGRSRVAQKSLSTQQYDSVGEQSHDPSKVEAIEKESS